MQLPAFGAVDITREVTSIVKICLLCFDLGLMNLAYIIVILPLSKLHKMLNGSNQLLDEVYTTNGAILS